MPKFVTVEISGIEPTEEIPAKESVISGTPKFTSWGMDEAAGGISAGIWQVQDLAWILGPHGSMDLGVIHGSWGQVFH